MIIEKYTIKAKNPLEYEFEIKRTKTRLVVDETVEIVDDSGNMISPRNPRKFNQKTSTSETITAISLPSREEAEVTIISSKNIDNDLSGDPEPQSVENGDEEPKIIRKGPISLSDLLNVDRPGSV